MAQKPDDKLSNDKLIKPLVLLAPANKLSPLLRGEFLWSRYNWVRLFHRRLACGNEH